MRAYYYTFRSYVSSIVKLVRCIIYGTPAYTIRDVVKHELRDKRNTFVPNKRYVAQFQNGHSRLTNDG